MKRLVPGILGAAALLIGTASQAGVTFLDHVKYYIEPPIRASTILRIELVFATKGEESGGDEYGFGNSGSSACGVELSWGDGDTQDLRIGSVDKPPYIYEHIYRRPGNFVLTVKGKTIVRGLNTAVACPETSHAKPILVR